MAEPLLGAAMVPVVAAPQISAVLPTAWVTESLSPAVVAEQPITAAAGHLEVTLVIPAALMLQPAPIPILVVAGALLHQEAYLGTVEPTVRRSATVPSARVARAATANQVMAVLAGAATTVAVARMVPAEGAGPATRCTL